MDQLHGLVSKLKELARELDRTPLKAEFLSSGVSSYMVEKHGGFLRLLHLAELKSNKIAQPKVLVFDIETLPMIVYSWDRWPEAIGLEQIIEDWSVASWSAKWLGEDRVFYRDQRKKSLKRMRDDRTMLREIWSLLDQADIVVTQNGKAFDVKKLNARFLKHGMKPPSSYRHYDTKIMAKRYFRFSSNRLAFMSEEFNTIYKKLDHAAFPGFKLWLECMAGNQKAWIEMERYNRHDVLALEELFMLFLPWDKTINWNVFHDDHDNVCSCGSVEFVQHRKCKTTNVGKYSRVVCTKCGKEHFVRDNVLSKEKRKNLLR